MALDHHLGRDAGMVGTDHPEASLPFSRRVADEDVLQRVVERMADMQIAGHVGRRIDDRPGLGARALRVEQAFAFPMGVPAGFDFGGVEGFGSSVSGGAALAEPMRSRWVQTLLAPPAESLNLPPSIAAPRQRDHRVKRRMLDRASAAPRGPCGPRAEPAAPVELSRIIAAGRQCRATSAGAARLNEPWRRSSELGDWERHGRLRRSAVIRTRSICNSAYQRSCAAYDHSARYRRIAFRSPGSRYFGRASDHTRYRMIV